MPGGTTTLAAHWPPVLRRLAEERIVQPRTRGWEPKTCGQGDIRNVVDAADVSRCAHRVIALGQRTSVTPSGNEVDVEPPINRGRIIHHKISEYLGAAAAPFECAPFGNLTVDVRTNADLFPRRFSAEPQGTFTGFHYYGYRYLDPVSGRWASRDPVGEPRLQYTDEVCFEPHSFRPSEQPAAAVFTLAENHPILDIDVLGLSIADPAVKIRTGHLHKMQGLDSTVAGVAALGGAQDWAMQAGFFPDTCEIGFFAIGPAILRPICSPIISC